MVGIPASGSDNRRGWYVTTRKLSFPHTDTNQLAPLIFSPSRSKISQIAKIDAIAMLALPSGIPVGV